MLNMASGGGCITFKQLLFILTRLLELLNIISGDGEKKAWTFLYTVQLHNLVQHDKDKIE